MKKKFTKITAMLLCVAMLCSVMMMSASALWVGSFTYKNADGEKIYNVFLWNENDEANDEYVLHTELTQYDASEYTFGAVFGSVYGEDLLTGERTWVNYDDIMYDLNNNRKMMSCWTGLSLDKKYTSHSLEFNQFVPLEVKATVIFGSYSYTQTDYYNHIYYYSDPITSEIDIIYFHVDYMETYETDWNYG